MNTGLAHNEPLPLIAVGGGGHCRSVLACAAMEGKSVTGILDKDTEVSGKYPVIGDDDKAKDYSADNEFIITVGHLGKGNKLRQRIAGHLDSQGVKWGNVIASSSFVADDAVVGAGTVILNNAVINANARVGKHVIINTGAIVEHDTVISDFVHISTGAIVNGGAAVGKNTFVGSGAIIIQGISICEDVTIGAGAIVVRDITVPGIYAGNPARKIH